MNVLSGGARHHNGNNSSHTPDDEQPDDEDGHLKEMVAAGLTVVVPQGAFRLSANHVVAVLIRHNPNVTVVGLMRFLQAYMTHQGRRIPVLRRRTLERAKRTLQRLSHCNKQEVEQFMQRVERERLTKRGKEAQTGEESDANHGNQV